MPGSEALTGNMLKQAIKLLEKVTGIMEANDIDYILDYGTLLGIVREGRLLPWDTDIDISLTEDQVDKFLKIRWKIWFAGYRTAVRHFKHDVGPYKKGDIRILKVEMRHFLFFKKHDIMDIFVKRAINNQYCYVVGVNHCVLKSSPRHFQDNKTHINFNGKNYPVPKDYENYLTYVYGNWRQPVKDSWDYLSSDNCFVEEFNFKKTTKNPIKKLYNKLTDKE